MLKNPSLQKIIDALKEKLEDDQKREFFERILVGGLKIMASDADMVDQRIQQDGDPAVGIGKGVVDLLGMIYLNSRKTMPWDVGVIAGYALVVEALDYAEEKGMVQVDQAVIDTAMQSYAETLMEKFGVTQDKVRQIMQLPEAQQRMGAVEGDPDGAEQNPAGNGGGLIDSGVMQ